MSGASMDPLLHPSVPLVTVDSSHRLTNARWLPSPHADTRPDPSDISLLVIHAISLPPGEFGGHFIDDLFLGHLDPTAHPYFESIRHLRVSAHACISREGRTTQYVEFDRRAWHAGVSRFQERTQCNDFSIGIELEGCDDQAFTDEQYRALVPVTRAILRAYPRLTLQRIVGHSDIAPGRKTDPGPHFAWDRFREAVKAGAGH